MSNSIDITRPVELMPSRIKSMGSHLCKSLIAWYQANPTFMVVKSEVADCFNVIGYTGEFETPALLHISDIQNA